MLRNKKIMLVVLLIILMVSLLCACIPDMVEEKDIVLRSIFSENICLGKYKIVTVSGPFGLGDIFEVRPGELEGLLNLFRNSEYFVDEFPLYQSLHTKTSNMRVGENTIWLAREGEIWLCQADGIKRAEVEHVSNLVMRNSEKKLSVELSEVIFMPEDKYPEFDKEYRTQLSWSQIKSFYSPQNVNDEEKSITLVCSYGDYNSKLQGTTKLYYNEQNNGFIVSSDFISSES